MLDIRPTCEQCGKALANTSTEAMICSFECTYCKICAMELFKDVCPSCGGNFVPRPIRTKAMTRKYPPSTKAIRIEKSETLIEKMKKRYVNIKPQER